MWGEWECILVIFYPNEILSTETWIYNLNEFTFSSDIERIKQYQFACLEQPHLTSVRLKPPIMCLAVEVHVKVASSFMHLSGLLWRYTASMKNIILVLEWCCPARAFSRALSFWPRSTTHSGAHSICTSMKSFHDIRKEIKSEGPLDTFFFPLAASQRRAGTMEALGCCRPRLRCTAETHSIIMRACRLWPSLHRMIHIVSITDPAAFR